MGRNWKAIACFFVALTWHTACAAQSQSRQLPDFGSPADSILSKSREAQLGRGVMLQLRNAGAVVDDPQLTEYIGLLGARLASQANNGDFNFNFFVVEDNSINAFAMPGGYIGVNAGLILASDNESELAGVLAHEVSHVTQRHIARSIYDNQRMSMVSIASMLAAILLSATTDMSGNAGQGLMMAGQAAALQRQINFTRANEYEADRIGMNVLSAAGFDPNGMAGFFEKLSRRSSIASQYVPEMLRTHPVTSGRIGEARSRARTLPQTRNVDSTGYALAKARLQVLSAQTPEVAAARFELRADSEAPADRYGRALALSRIALNDDAERLFRGLVSDYPAVIAYRIGQAEALMASGLTDSAMAIYEEAEKLFPRNIPMTISYAEALISAGEPAKAHKLLLDLLNNVPPTPTQIQLIARAANAEGDISSALYYMSEYYISIGNLPLAINQIRMALESPDVNFVDQARYEAKLKQWTEYMDQNSDRGRRSNRER